MNPLFPTLTCGVFVFSSVSAFLLLRLPSLTHSLTSFASQAWDNVHCQGVGCTPWRPLGSASFAWQAHSLTLTHSSLLRGQAWDNVHCQGVGCTPWRPLGSASFAWQPWDNVHCQGVGCTPWRPLGSASFAWQVWGNVHCQGSDVASLGLRLFCVAGVGQCALPRGWMYALAYFGLRLFCVAGVGQCALPRGRMYALACLGLRFFCVAGVGQCAFCVAGVGQCVLPRGRMYALASLGLRLFCVAGLADWCLDSDLSAQVMMLVYGTWTAYSPTHSLSLTHSLTHSFTHSLIHTPSLLYFLFPFCFSMLSPSLKKLVTCGVIRSFNLHWGKSFDFMAPADSVRRLEMQNFGLPQFCASFGVFSCGVCRSRAESVHLLKPYLQWGKG